MLYEPIWTGQVTWGLCRPVMDLSVTCTDGDLQWTYRVDCLDVDDYRCGGLQWTYRVDTLDVGDCR